MKVAGIDVPQDVDFTACLSLGERAVGLGKNSCNMQEDPAAFEAWALFFHVKNKFKKIHLDLKSDVELPIFKSDTLSSDGHFNRFLYRVMNFKNQYGDWFKIDEKLARAVKIFEQALNKEHFCGNRPERSDSADRTKPEHRERQVETAFAGSGDGRGAGLLKNFMQEKYGIEVGQIFRQLSVGLFLGDKSETTRVFTGAASAIDLWALSADKREIIICRPSFPFTLDNPTPWV